MLDTKHLSIEKWLCDWVNEAYLYKVYSRKALYKNPSIHLRISWAKEKHCSGGVKDLAGNHGRFMLL